MDTCICMAESFHYSAETTMASFANTSLQNNKLKKKKRQQKKTRSVSLGDGEILSSKTR